MEGDEEGEEGDEEGDEEEGEEGDEEEGEEGGIGMEVYSSSSDESESDEDEEYNEELLKSKKVKDLKNLLEKMQQKNVSGKKQDMINCLMNCRPVFKGGGSNDNMMYGGVFLNLT